MRASWSASAAFLFVLAGCAGPSETEQLNGPEGLAKEAGLLTGAVLDDALVPLEGAFLVLDGQDSTTTDESGRFRFANVKPGDHVLVATREAYEAATTTVTVLAGEETSVSILLRPAPNADAYHETRIKSGLISCSFATRRAGSNSSYLNLCLPLFVVSPTLDQTRVEWPLGGLDNVTGFWTETVWRSSQAFGRSLYVEWNVNTDGIQNGVRFASKAGQSPIAQRIPIDNLTALVAKNPSPPSKCGFSKCEVFNLHTAFAETLGPSAPVDVGVVLQQRFDDHVTIFHREALPLVFSSLADQ